MMSRTTIKKVVFSPDADDKPTSTAGVYRKQGFVVGTKVGGNKKRVAAAAAIWGFRISKSSGFSPVRFLKRIGSKFAKALRFMSSRKRSSRKVSSASLARSRSYAETLDSQRTEAIEDCIEFLNSSSSLQRSNSVASSC